MTLLTAGAFAILAFDTFVQALSPLFGFADFAPVELAGASLDSTFGANPAGAAHLLHIMTGLVFYVLCYYAAARPLQRAVLPGLQWSITATLYGILLWVFALFVIAHLVAGMPAFLGFSGITWIALWGHILYALVAAGIIETRGEVFGFPNLPRPMQA